MIEILYNSTKGLRNRNKTAQYVSGTNLDIYKLNRGDSLNG